MTANQKVCTVAKSLMENLIIHYGFPEKLYRDQLTDFGLKTIKELHEFTGIKKFAKNSTILEETLRSSKNVKK